MKKQQNKQDRVAKEDRAEETVDEKHADESSMSKSTSLSSSILFLVRLQLNTNQNWKVPGSHSNDKLGWILGFSVHLVCRVSSSWSYGSQIT